MAKAHTVSPTSLSEKACNEAAEEWCDLHSSTTEYASRFSGVVGNWMVDVQTRCLRSLLGAGRSVLDVGGGHGQVLSALAAGPYELSLYTSSLQAVGVATPIVEKLGILTFQGPLYPLPFADRSFDTVISLRTATHMENWQMFLSELARVAKHQVIIDYPTTRSINIFSTLLFEKKLAVEKNTRPFKVFKESEIKDVFREAGLSKFSRAPQFFFPMAAHRAMGSYPCSACLEAVARYTGLTQLAGSPVLLSASRV